MQVKSTMSVEEFPDFSFHHFDQPSVEPRFPGIDADDIVQMRETNQNKNTMKSTTKKWMKVFDMWRKSEVK